MHCTSITYCTDRELLEFVFSDVLLGREETIKGKMGRVYLKLI